MNGYSARTEQETTPFVRVDIESRLIGAFALDPSLLTKYGDLDPETFKDSSYRRLYQLFQQRHRVGLAPYPLEDVAGDDAHLRSVLNDAYSSCPSSLYAVEDIKVLLQCKQGRDIQRMVEKAVSDLYDTSAAAALQTLQEGIAHISGADTPSTQDEETHPLALRIEGKLDLGWIDEYADLMTELTGSPREFHLLAGLVIVASVIGRRACLKMAFGDVYANIYGAIIARSSVYHKSAAMAKARSLLHRSMMTNLLLSELMTSEGLLKELQSKPTGLIIRDEIGTLFAAHHTKYLVQLKPDLTALYDGYPYSRRLSQDKVEVKEPYLNILGATTPARFYEGVSFADWQDGFLPRWLFVMPEEEPNFDSEAGTLDPAFDARLAKLAFRLMQLDKQPEQDFILGEDAYKTWHRWRVAAVKEAYLYGDDTVSAIVERYATYALKFAIILTAISGTWGEISATTMQTACDLADSFKLTMYRLVTEKSNYGVSGAKLQKVFRVIRDKSGAAGITAREVMQLCNMGKSEFGPCMDKLLSIGAVMANEGVRTTRYTAAVASLPAKIW